MGGRRNLLAAAVGVGVCLVLVVSSQFAQQRAVLVQDGMAIGSGGMPLSMTGGGDESAASNPFLDAMESSVLAARSLRQKMGGPSMRESVGRAQLHQLHAKQRAAEEAAADETLKNYEKQEEAAQASQQLAAEPQVSGMALGSGGRPLPMHLDAEAANAAMWPAGAQAKAQHAKTLALFDKLSPQTQQLLLDQKSGLTLQQAAAATMRQMQRGYSSDAMAARTQILWNAQKSSPYNPMGHVSQMQQQTAKVNKMIDMWNSKADNAPAGSYTDY